MHLYASICSVQAVSEMSHCTARTHERCTGAFSTGPAWSVAWAVLSLGDGMMTQSSRTRRQSTRFYNFWLNLKLSYAQKHQLLRHSNGAAIELAHTACTAYKQRQNSGPVLCRSNVFWFQHPLSSDFTRLELLRKWSSDTSMTLSANSDPDKTILRKILSPVQHPAKHPAKHPTPFPALHPVSIWTWQSWTVVGEVRSDFHKKFLSTKLSGIPHERMKRDETRTR